MVSGSGGFGPLKSGWEMSEPIRWDSLVVTLFSYKIDIDG